MALSSTEQAVVAKGLTGTYTHLENKLHDWSCVTLSFDGTIVNILA